MESPPTGPDSPNRGFWILTLRENENGKKMAQEDPEGVWREAALELGMGEKKQGIPERHNINRGVRIHNLRLQPVLTGDRNAW